MKRCLYILALFILTIGLFSCNNDDSEELQLTVASVEIFALTESTLEEPQKVETRIYIPPRYYVKTDKNMEWESLTNISGFIHEEGYEYVILIRKEKYPNDIFLEESEVSSSELEHYKITFLSEISKTKKDSENIPSQRGRFKVASKITGDENFPYYVYGWSKEFNKYTWLKCPPIEGFAHEIGYEYYIEVNCKYNGVNAFPKYSYTYVNTYGKEQKDSENLPE